MLNTIAGKLWTTFLKCPRSKKIVVSLFNSSPQVKWNHTKIKKSLCFTAQKSFTFFFRELNFSSQVLSVFLFPKKSKSEKEKDITYFFYFFY